MLSAIAIVLAYLLGSVSSAILVSHALRLPDPRTSGSRNPGATNVLRTGGRTAALITLLGDVAKGWLPVFIVLQWTDLPGWAAGAVGLAAFLGHVLPVYYRFQGGKGVATALGVLLALNPLVALLSALTWLAVAAIWRYSSLAALVAAGAAPLYLAFAPGEPDFWIVTLVAVMALILFIRHDENIRRLMRGEESRIGEKKKPASGEDDAGGDGSA
ncbi:MULTISPECIES: glycerol-3-phosphate 1-O-acyltransferase PlsY [Thioalkalivibrio]|uniref:Glycerol-3-phosphate acyltransferase n=1 Tax=Thioalkalivibrio halophilus TaxID=252474 RepID=A0A1V3A2G7_9GAMM|nr:MULTISPECIES: glycerol-3-phosphate 1-O-acyltransferase PlsY [Thioalkalivibrio]OOC11273.1 glycerol-3-phosphate acyltransferase [Thioalkalivibrio halophilus]